jgi:hypothetical protein
MVSPTDYFDGRRIKGIGWVEERKGADILDLLCFVDRSSLYISIVKPT